ncbi:MAG: hypothetical protein R3D28_20430 [Geminicoccaceae bacterium]
MATATTGTVPSLLDTVPKGLVYGAFCVVIVVQLLNIFTFNWHPELRLPLSAMLAAIHLVLAAVTLLMRRAQWAMLLLLSATINIAVILPPHMLGLGGMHGLDMTELSRRLVLPLMMIWMLGFPLALPVRLLRGAAVFGTLYAGFIVLTEPQFVYNPNDGYLRFASLTGGFDQVHLSAKFVALQIVLLDLLRRGKLMSPLVTWAMIGICVVLMDGYGARAQLLFVAIYLLYLAYCKYRSEFVVRWLPFLGLVLTITVAVVALQVGTDVSQWGSGRIGTWHYRILLIADRDLITLLFGSGVGADNMWTPQWGWGDDTLISHNDYLYFLTDHGIIGLLIPATFLYGLWIRLGDYGRAIVMAIMISSIVDNGYFRTPMLAGWLAIVLSTSLLVSLLKGDVPAPNRKPANAQRREMPAT